jgi:hypothetical protein
MINISIPCVYCPQEMDSVALDILPFVRAANHFLLVITQSIGTIRPSCPNFYTSNNPTMEVIARNIQFTPSHRTKK